MHSARRRAVVAAGLFVTSLLGAAAHAEIIGTGGAIDLTPLVLDFDTDANGQPIVHGQVIDDEYAAWGVAIDVQHPTHDYLDFGVALGTDVSLEADMRTSVAFGAFHPSNDTFLGNVLIAPRNDYDFNHDDILDTPDTAFERPNGLFTFTLSNTLYASGALTIVDAEEAGGTVTTYLNGSMVGSVVIPALGDNSVVTVNLPDQSPFNQLVVHLAGSGGLNDVTFIPVPEPGSAALLAGLATLGLRRKR